MSTNMNLNTYHSIWKFEERLDVPIHIETVLAFPDRVLVRSRTGHPWHLICFPSISVLRSFWFSLSSQSGTTSFVPLCSELMMSV